MSLRIFHVVFIVASVALCLYVGLWGVREFVRTSSNGGLALAVVFFACGGALVVYGKKTFRKLRELP